MNKLSFLCAARIAIQLTPVLKNSEETGLGVLMSEVSCIRGDLYHGHDNEFY